MASTIKIKNGTSGAPSSLAQGELAMDVSIGKLFHGTTGGTAVSSSFTFTEVTASGIIKAEHFLSTDDAEITDDLTVGGDIAVDGISNLDNTDIDGTFTMDGTAFDVNATTTLTLDNSNTTNGVTINTGTSGGPISIGHATSETTVNDNLVVTGNITANGNIVGDDSTNITNISNINLDTINDDATGGDTNIALTGTTLNIEVGGETFLETTGTTAKFSTNITASGDISASSADGILTYPRRHLDQTVQGSVTDSTGSLAQGDIYHTQASVATVPGKIYFLQTNGNYSLADKDAESSAAGLIGVAIGTNSSTDGLLLRGMVKLHTNPFPGEGALGSPAYLGDSGLATGSIEDHASDDFIRIMGYGISGSGTIYFNPDNTFIKKA